MMKSIALLPRRPDLSRAQFRDYYETRHAPLALRYFPFAKYVRNHLAGDEAIGFDTISEFWSHDPAKLRALMESDVGDIMRTDERRFMDQPRIRSAGAEEHLLAGAPRPVESGPARKEALLLKAADGVELQRFVAAAGDWGWGLAAKLGNRAIRVTLDIVRPWPDQPFPYDALLWAWRTDMRPALHNEPAPPGIEIAGAVMLDSMETPADALLTSAALGS